MKWPLLLLRPWYWLPTLSVAYAGYFSNTTAVGYGQMIVVGLLAGPILSGFAEGVNDLADANDDVKGSRKYFYWIPMSGGSGAVADPAFSPRLARLLLLTLATVGVGLAAFCSVQLLAVYVLGLSLGAAYSLNPLKLKGRALCGPIVQGLGYGPVAFHVGVLGAGSQISKDTLWVSALVGIWVAAIGLSADLLDYDDDRSSGVRTLPVVWGRERSRRAICLVGSIVLIGLRSWRSSSPVGLLIWLLSGFLFCSYGWELLRHKGTPVSSSLHAKALCLECLFPWVVIL